MSAWERKRTDQLFKENRVWERKKKETGGRGGLKNKRSRKGITL